MKVLLLIVVLSLLGCKPPKQATSTGPSPAAKSNANAVPRIHYIYSAGDDFVLLGEDSIYVGSTTALARIGIVGRNFYGDGGSQQIELAGGGEVFSPSRDLKTTGGAEDNRRVGTNNAFHEGPTFKASRGSIRTALVSSDVHISAFREALLAAR